MDHDPGPPLSDFIRSVTCSMKGITTYFARDVVGRAKWDSTTLTRMIPAPVLGAGGSSGLAGTCDPLVETGL